MDADDDAKGQYVFARYAAQNDHYVGPYKTTTKTINFLVGEQWRSRWDGTSMTWQAQREIPPWRQQPTTNITYAIYRSALAKLTKQKPALDVVPPSANSEDQEAAELAEAVLVYLWRYLGKPQKLPLLIGWLLTASMAFIRVGWDPEAGEVRGRTVPMPRRQPSLGADTSGATLGAPADELAEDVEDADVAADENGEPYQTADGQPDYDRKPDREPTGEICWGVVSPMSVRFNPDATSLDDVEEYYVGTLWPKNKVAQFFNVPEDQLGPAGESAEQRQLYEDLMSASTAGFPRSWSDQTSLWGVSQENAIGARLLVVEYYAKPCRDYPDGRHWITAGMKKVWPPRTAREANDRVDAGTEDGTQVFPNGEAPLPFGFWPPLVPCVDTPVPGQPAGIPLLGQVVPLNEALNTLDGKISEKHVTDAMGGIWFASPEDKGIRITTEPGQVVYSNAMGRRGAAFAPQQARMTALPAPVYGERDVLMSKILTVTGLSGTDLSQKAEGTPSGRALLVTQETSDAVLTPTLQAVERALEEAGRRELVIAQQKYRDERLISIKADDGQWISRKFRGADLRDGLDVRVETGSMFPWSKSAQWDTRIQFLQATPGLFINPKTGEVDEQKLARFLEPGAPGLQAFDYDEEPNAVEIRREHLIFEQYDPESGDLQIPQVGFWQDHVAHLKGHYEFIKKDWARVQRMHPVARAAFFQHCELTQHMIEQMAETAVAAQGGVAPTDSPPQQQEPHGGGLALVRPETQTPGPGQARLTRADLASAQHG